MAKKDSVSSESSSNISARVHCAICGGRFVKDVTLTGAKTKGSKTLTKCEVCEKNNQTSYLIFDREYPKGA